MNKFLSAFCLIVLAETVLSPLVGATQYAYPYEDSCGNEKIGIVTIAFSTNVVAQVFKPYYDTHGYNFLFKDSQGRYSYITVVKWVEHSWDGYDFYKHGSIAIAEAKAQIPDSDIKYSKGSFNRKTALIATGNGWTLCDFGYDPTTEIVVATQNIDFYSGLSDTLSESSRYIK